MENTEENCEMIWKLWKYTPNLCTIRLAFLPCFPYHFTFQPTFLMHLSYRFTIQLAFFLFSISCHLWKKSNSNSENDMKIMEETRVEYRKDLEKYGRKAS
jgi:hypothetical protein